MKYGEYKKLKDNLSILKKDHLYYLMITDDPLFDTDKKTIEFEIVTEIKRYQKIPFIVFEDGEEELSQIHFEDLRYIQADPETKGSIEWGLNFDTLTEEDQNCYFIKEIGHKKDHLEYFL